MLTGELYAAFDPALLAARTRAKRLAAPPQRDGVPAHRRGPHRAGRAAAPRGRKPYVEPPFRCDYGSNIYCGNNVYFNVNCVVLDAARATIGSNVLFGPGVQLYAATHPLDAEVRRPLELA